ncbi:MAG: M13 family metallopeptidase [bacterium]|nr:M13 family metallopeptidase [bacterium]
MQNFRRKAIKRDPKYWGFDVGNLDRKVRPQDDFYNYANGGWIRKNKIPPAEARWGTFTMLRYTTEQQLKNIVEDLLQSRRPSGSGPRPKRRGKHFKKGTPEQLIADMYRSAMDTARRDKLGHHPLLAWRKDIQNITSKKEIVGHAARMHRLGGLAFWELELDQDAKNSNRYLLHLVQDGLGMPDREYYLSHATEQKRVREAYKAHIKKLLRLFGFAPAAAEQAMRTVMKIETHLAKISMPKEETRDVEKTYNKKSLTTLMRELPQIDWREYFALLDAGAERLPAQAGEVVVAQPKFFRGLGRLFDNIPLQDWKIYLEWHCINSFAPLLSQKFARASFNFYGTVLTGSKKMRPLWRRALGSVNTNVGDALGKRYVQKHFSKGAKKQMEALVRNLFVAYEVRIKKLDWMSAATKQKALHKLHAMNRKIGYPAQWETYRGLTIRPDDYFGNVLRSREFEHCRGMRRLQKSVNRHEWFMTPQTVNAYCHFNLNEIVFPAAILQPPFFDSRADDAVNYGAIGAVIGHEITHGFDDQGSKFDAHGNMHSWWTKKDSAYFVKKGHLLTRQFNQYEVVPGVRANGKLTLGENSADLGGAAIAYDALQRRLVKTGRKVVAGFTPEQRFFLGFAQGERELARVEFTKTQAFTDPHAAAPLRVNGPASNLPAFYEAFNVKKGDKLFRTEKNRARIW